MQFNSIAFLCFFPLICLIYWALPNHKNGGVRNAFLLIASYYFYMNWEPAYALLIGASTLTSWFCAIKASPQSAGISNEATKKSRKLWFITGILFNCSLLFIFKYLNFITAETFHLLSIIGIRLDVPSFSLLLPVGVSFYTFQVIGYLADVKNGEIPPERNLARYALFVAFFPQLVAGPIENASNMIPQFRKPHYFNADNFISGITMMLWGYFMKICIADNVSPYVDAAFNNPAQHTGTTLLLATFFYSFQILCDFGGYSLIALGAAKAIGFHLIKNFRQPYLATSIRDFWHRWHVSLSGWFTKYVYIPLGGSRCGRVRHLRNIMVVFLLSGIWHGANWTFLAWGGAHGVMMSVHSLWSRRTTRQSWRIPASAMRILSIITTFTLAALAWVLFRAESISDAFTVYHKIFTDWGALYHGQGRKNILLCLLLISVLMIHEWRENQKADSATNDTPRPLLQSIIISAALIVTIISLGNFNANSFIYFQF